MKIFPKFIAVFFFLAATAVILTLNLYPLYTLSRRSPTGRTYGLIHNNVQDFYFYQSLMNEGANGQWLTTDPFTSEAHQPSIIFSYFLWLGKLSSIFHLPYAVTYHLIRIALGFLFLLASYFLILKLKLPYPRLTYLFFLFAAPFLHQVTNAGKTDTTPFMYFWTGIDPIRRAAYLPHHMFGGLFLVISLILIIKFISDNSRKNLFWLILIAPILAFVHTPSLFILLLILPVSLIIYNTFSQKARGTRDTCLTDRQAFATRGTFWLLVYWIIGLLVLFLMFSQTNRGFPWSQYISWEKTQQFPLTGELFGAMGILLPFSLIGLIRALGSRRFEYILAACWLAVPILLIPIAPKLNISNIRLIQGVPFLPLAILATLGITSIREFFIVAIRPLNSKLKMQSAKLQFKIQNYLRYIGSLDNWIIGLLIFIFTVFTYPTLSWSLKDQIREFWTIYSNVYLDDRLFPAFDYINNNYPAKSITLATFYTGNYLPAFTNTVSFIGHTGYTDNVDIKQPSVEKFFAVKMKEDEARDFLLRNKITLVFQGPDEKSYFNGVLYPNILKKTYDTEAVTLYTKQ